MKTSDEIRSEHQHAYFEHIKIKNNCNEVSEWEKEDPAFSEASQIWLGATRAFTSCLNKVQQTSLGLQCLLGGLN